MNYDNEKLFNVRKTTDERLFTSRVMAEIRSRQPAENSWRVFTRWATPVLALSLGSFIIAAAYSLQPDTVSAETLLLGDQGPEISEEWLASPTVDDEMMPQLEVTQ